LFGLLTCSSFVPNSSANQNFAEFCDHPIDGDVRRALNAQEANQGSAVGDWAKVDREVVNQAPWVPFENLIQADFVSRRVGDHQYNPTWGEMVDQLWVR
jgi:peptide/nickel transport system substrate-binding protein